MNERTFVKKIINPENVLDLEIDCITRLNNLEERYSRHFPKIINSYNVDEQFFLELSHCGVSIKDLNDLNLKPYVRDWKLQIKEILDALEMAEIQYLDFNLNGQNLCINNQGELVLIDFNVVYDTTVFTKEFFTKYTAIKRFYRKFLVSKLSYKNWARRQLLIIISKNCLV